MTRTERNRCVHWSLGWLPGGKLELCPRHPTQVLTKVMCNRMPRYVSSLTNDRSSSRFLYRSFSTNYQIEYHVPLTLPLHSLFDGPVICTILYELDYLLHDKDQLSPPFQPGPRLLDWLPSSPH
ncbi:hypothetical protein G6F36_011763 [Rhizopus arrhizus]|nr:hypothetical protein G6F36_011763 [Rhizopus arrhizus]